MKQHNNPTMPRLIYILPPLLLTLLLALLCFIYQCGPKDMNERLASYIEHNEQNIEGLRDWDIYFETERSFWSC